jgi:poly(3-hydroxybutyrate) depolymerase
MMHRSWIFTVVVFAALAMPAAAAEPPAGYHAKVSVQAATRLDWVFAVANQSPAAPPANWLVDYDSTATQYELFVPPIVKARKPAPLILFISAGETPAGWSQWQAACKQAGFVFASPFGAGNGTPSQRRVRMVLDVLDDIGRRTPVDPDRIYLAGFSGGARVACAIAFALPEYFGGAIGVCGAENLREESWLRQRVVDRLSVALITGEQDFNRGELERLRGPMLSDVGVRTKVWTVAELGHAIPDSQAAATVLKWLDEGAADRRRAARQWPAMRIAASDVPSRVEWADALLKEAQQRLQKPATLYSGLMQLQGLSTRWADAAAAATARKLLAEYDSRTDRPWEQDDLAEQRRFLIAQARAVDRYGTGTLPPQYEKQRGDMIRGALELWQKVRDDAPDSPAGKEAAQRIGELQRRAGDS